MLKEGIAVVSAEGIGNIAKWHRLYTALGIECFCVFDTDSNKGGDVAADLLAKRTDITSALGRECDPAETTTILGEPLFVGDGYATLDPNFEGAMRSLFGVEWSRLHEEATASVGESKPLRARYAAQRLGVWDFTGTPGERLDALVSAIRGESPGEQPAAEDTDDPWGGDSPWGSTPDPWTVEEPPF